jgi:hypothetical protein
MATLADGLSRESTIKPDIIEKMERTTVHRLSGKLGRWLEASVLDWDLPRKIIKDVKTLLAK